MSMQRYTLKISLLFVVLFNNTVLLGMERAEQTTVTVYQKPSTLFPVEIMIQVAAEGSGEVKNRLRKTCGFFSQTFTKDSLEFLSHPSFTAHKKDIEDIICSAAWFNNVQKEQALAHYNVKNINFDTSFKPNSLKPNCSIGLPVNDLKLLRNKYNNSNNIPLTEYELSWEVEQAFCCAVQCNDLETVNNISPKIKRYSCPNFNLHKCLLMQIIQKDRAELFKVVVENDPMEALNLYCKQAEDPSYHRPFLDVLINADYISQDLKDKYSRIYRACGGKTRDQLEEEEKMSQYLWKNCIIS